MIAGELIAPETFPAITREQLARYAEASGDPNPIHLDDAAAKKMGLPGVIAHGMLSAAFIAERAERYLRERARELKPTPGSVVKLAEFQTRFKAKVFPGDVLVIGGTVKEVSADGSFVLDLQARNAKGEVVTTGTVRYSVSAAT